jgi:MtN3 and saliva related transmembrane protein
MIDYNVVGLVAATLTTISFLPQAIQTFKTKKTKDISLPMYLALTLGVCLWLIYGLYLQSLPIILANSITLVFASCILFLKIKHG